VIASKKLDILLTLESCKFENMRCFVGSGENLIRYAHEVPGANVCGTIETRNSSGALMDMITSPVNYQNISALFKYNVTDSPFSTTFKSCYKNYCNGNNATAINATAKIDCIGQICYRPLKPVDSPETGLKCYLGDSKNVTKFNGAVPKGFVCTKVEFTFPFINYNETMYLAVGPGLAANATTCSQDWCNGP
jgi:hypothetical protein